MAEKRYTLQAPAAHMAGMSVQCEITGNLVRIGDDGLLPNLTEAQAQAFSACGYLAVEGREILELRFKADFYARATAAFTSAEDEVISAIRAARAAGMPEVEVDEVLRLAGRPHQTVLPGAAELAPIEKKAAEPAVEKKAEAPAEKKAVEPAEKKPGKKTLSEALQIQKPAEAQPELAPAAPDGEPSPPPDAPKE